MNLPNKLTIFRIILIPFFILILAAPIFFRVVSRLPGQLLGMPAGLPLLSLLWLLSLIFGWANCPEKAFSHQLWKICGSFG